MYYTVTCRWSLTTRQILRAAGRQLFNSLLAWLLLVRCSCALWLQAGGVDAGLWIVAAGLLEPYAYVPCEWLESGWLAAGALLVGHVSV